MWSKENHTENSKRENAKEKAESVKTEQSVKTNFFEALPWLKSKIGRIIKVLYTYKDHAQNILDHLEFFPGRAGKNGDGKVWLTKNLFLCRNPNLALTSIRTLLGTTNAIKERYKGVATAVNKTP